MKYELKEVYKINHGWLKIEKVLTIDEIRNYFEDENITTVHIAEQGEYFGSDYSKSSFNYEFPTVESTLELVKKEAYYEIYQATGIELDMNKLNIRVQDTYVRNAAATYSLNTVTFNPEHFNELMLEKDYRSLIEILVHELGHYIHELYFNNKNVKLPADYRSKYARKNCMEDFAEAFMDLVICPSKQNRTHAETYRKPDKRNSRMLQLLYSV